MRSFTDDQTLINAAKISATFTADATTDVLTATAHGLSNGDLLTVTNSGGGLPGGLSAGVWYYVISAAANTFKLSTSSGGSAVDITSNGTGTQTFYREILNMMDVSSFDFVTVSLHTASSCEATVRWYAAVGTAMPNISQVQSTTNSWDHIGHRDIDTYATNIESGITGATGIAMSGTDKHQVIRFDVRGLKWFGALTQTFKVGTIVCRARASSQT
jgi:hypothetical protein